MSGWAVDMRFLLPPKKGFKLEGENPHRRQRLPLTRGGSETECFAVFDLGFALPHFDTSLCGPV